MNKKIWNHGMIQPQFWKQFPPEKLLIFFPHFFNFSICPFCFSNGGEGEFVCIGTVHFLDFLHLPDNRQRFEHSFVCITCFSTHPNLYSQHLGTSECILYHSLLFPVVYLFTRLCIEFHASQHLTHQDLGSMVVGRLKFIFFWGYHVLFVMNLGSWIPIGSKQQSFPHSFHAHQWHRIGLWYL